ncbi:MAG: hypothetical protein CMJ64_24725 [Planctomycetaceae bacterium]|nr:hypothetical protein [Planctomycetaceae bacterium]
MTIVGYACIAVAVLWILFKAQLAYKSEGGRMVVTVYDAAVYPPLLIVFGLYWVLLSLEINWSIWLYVLLFLVLVAAVAGVIKLAEEFGERRL